MIMKNMTKTAKVLLVIIISTLIAAFFFPPIVMVSLLADVVLFIYLIVRRLRTPKEDLQKIRKENDALLAKWNAKAEQSKVELEKMRVAERARKADDRRVVSTVLISTDNKKSAVGAAGRAVVGGALLGPVGAIAGAASGKSKAAKATFSVKYASGRTATETVDIGSRRFNELSALLHK